MRTLVDWISTSLPLNNILWKVMSTGELPEFPPHLEQGTTLFTYLMSFNDIKATAGRAPFKNGFRSPSGGFSYYESPNLEYSLLEFSGKGCSVLRKRKFMNNVFAIFRDNITRVDIACDITDDVDPITFANARTSKRFKSYGIQKSESGTTVYVGSKSSDRYARVYKYNLPHPRAGILRCEMVFRDNEAKSVSQALYSEGVSSTAAACGKIFGWVHPSWLNKTDVDKLSSVPRESHKGKTERWLMKQVLPACKKLLELGEDESLKIFADNLIQLINDYENDEGEDE